MLDRRLPFAELVKAIGPDLFNPYSGKPGVIIQNFAAVNVNCDADNSGPFKGRLYSLLVGRDFDQLRHLDKRMLAAIEGLGPPAVGDLA